MIHVTLRCSCCGLQRESERLVCAGPVMVICDECVAEAAKMMAEGPVARWLREVGEAEYASWFTASE